jgi:hypothetical protein
LLPLLAFSGFGDPHRMKAAATVAVIIRAEPAAKTGTVIEISPQKGRFCSVADRW